MGSAVSRGSEDGAGSSHFYFKHNCCRRALGNQRVLQKYQALGNGIIRFPGTEGSRKWDLLATLQASPSGGGLGVGAGDF